MKFSLIMKIEVPLFHPLKIAYTGILFKWRNDLVFVVICFLFMPTSDHIFVLSNQFCVFIAGHMSFQKKKKFLQPCQGVWLNLRQLKCVFQPEKSDGCRLLGTIICLAHGLGWCTRQTTCLPPMRPWFDAGLNFICGSLLVLYSVL